MTDTKIEKVKTAPLAAPSIEAIVASAVNDKLPAAELKELLAVYREMQADRAKQAFNLAMADFRAKCPLIPRKRTADIATRSGAMKYDYAALEDIAAVIDPVLTGLGLSYCWPSTTEDGGKLIVTCRVSHVDGHSEPGAFVVPVESGAGMSAQQKYASASTYARRYSLIAALGLSTVDPDDDGRGDTPPETISTEEAMHIEDMLNQLGVESEINRARKSVLDYIECEKLSDCPAAQYGRVVNKLQLTLDAQEGT